MAEKMKDAEDRMLASMFQSEPIADDGFSKRVVLRIRRRLWVRRLALPFATAIGGAVSLKPLSELVIAAAKLLTVMPERLFEVPTAWLPQMESVVFGASLTQMVVLAAMLLAAGLLGTRMLIE
jgi:hypothetical protein